MLTTPSGYIGGTVPNPSYEQVQSGSTGYTEAVRVTYDPTKASCDELLRVSWRDVDPLTANAPWRDVNPLTANAQFCDAGPQYRSAILFLDDQQKQLAETSKTAVVERFSPRPIATEIAPASTFYPAEGCNGPPLP